MSDVAKRLKFIAVEYNAIVILTNYTVQEGKKAALGEFWSFIPDISLFIEMSEGRRSITLLKSKRSPKNFKFFSIESGGIKFENLN
jgi:hypothetical protein